MLVNKDSFSNGQIASKIRVSQSLLIAGTKILS